MTEPSISGGKETSRNSSTAKGQPSQPKGCKHSFDPATKVLMADGSTKAIAEVALGDQVKAADPETGRETAEPVEALFTNQDSELTSLTVALADGSRETLSTTQHHPFWSETRQAWVDAGDLVIGELLRAEDGGTVSVAGVVNERGDKAMQDLTVANVHTYHVLAGNSPILVHNCNETYYRTMSQEHFDTLQSTGKLSATRKLSFRRRNRSRRATRGCS
ncbi:hypothetical protein GCM10010123_38970 [Pilimelia anulata]|uniref:Uncharacterized protein n=1 Tax=Pilimelia anulata TaxID=53371 RepID=A0A8J3BFH5_9ACTN|nr:polymorphic toxin-type HINT domain-containing protein [Pilimelia anulata]GGK05303.1 hypothetical protein GCM10010123_38970 [Pilimelia anulata]